jgi:hypothetical protein
MDRAEPGNRRRVVSVNATIDFYGDRIPERYPLMKPQKDFSEVYSKELSKSHFTIAIYFYILASSNHLCSSDITLF